MSLSWAEIQSRARDHAARQAERDRFRAMLAEIVSGVLSNASGAENVLARLKFLSIAIADDPEPGSQAKLAAELRLSAARVSQAVSAAKERIELLLAE